MAFSFDIKGILVGMVLPILLGQGKDALAQWLDDFHTKEPVWAETVIICAQRLLDAHGEELAVSTENPYDNMAVEAALSVLGTAAAKYGIELQVP